MSQFREPAINFSATPVYVAQDAEDVAAVRRCLQGDQAAFTPIVERYQRVLFTVAARSRRAPAFRRTLVRRDRRNAGRARQRGEVEVVHGQTALGADAFEIGSRQMTTRHPDERLDDLLHDLGPADPPADFSRTVSLR